MFYPVSNTCTAIMRDVLFKMFDWMDGHTRTYDSPSRGTETFILKGNWKSKVSLHHKSHVVFCYESTLKTKNDADILQIWNKPIYSCFDNAMSLYGFLRSLK